ncbi:MAG: lipid-A-disaccharide synthase-related protein [Gloeomargarita sp. SKYBB_i_bin120]|nr:lipid-A-disaccharide synthase-related protein [Gloeomargarita sp. SKYG98]MCS7291749.1 lipid-A-disaccharide synthase-related protein [Gloeomargarita sp. SKYB120]MDW8177309.1 lipid-A-disaccharide synthase-related protein [Gloeomargarita sp. SKYBB_i_bin120]
MRLLCLSNGHGEDRIAGTILTALQQEQPDVVLRALPLVGRGETYRRLGIPLIGPARDLPSGGFLPKGWWQDLRAGLGGLVWQQWRAVRQWARASPQGWVLAVGDIWPLGLAWQSGRPFVFVATAKSEYHLRDEQGPLPKTHWLEGWAGSVFYPWERWLIRRSRVTFPRDELTTTWLKRWQLPVLWVGNPMMDGLEPTGQLSLPPAFADALVIVLLPGSRVPEAYRNWELILQALPGVVEHLTAPQILFLAAIAPTVDPREIERALRRHRWPVYPGVGFGYGQVGLMVTQGCFNDCIHLAHAGIALAGTATEQLVGLGKPVVSFPGPGPQYTRHFARYQQRLLGPSLRLVDQPEAVGPVLQEMLSDPDTLHLIARNGRQRMGTPGASLAIARWLAQHLRKASLDL